MIQLYEKDLPRNKTDTVIKAFRKDKTMLTHTDVQFILGEMQKKNKNDNVQIMIRARNKHRMTTLKGFETDLINYDQEYYRGAGDNFDEYFYLEISFRK